MHNRKRVLLTGGGTGGHIIPNRAVATALRKLEPNLELIYIGSRNKLDAQLVKEAHIPFHSIFAGKLRRYFSWRNFVDPFLVLIGFLQSFVIILRFRPHVVFSKGGYVSLPVVLAAYVLRRPIILHESDSVMGLTNRITAKLAKKVCVAFPDLVKKNNKFVLTGNPVRLEMRKGNIKEGYLLTLLSPDRPILLVWGGSQGAQAINEMIMRDFDKIKLHFQIVHITGKGKGTGIKDPSYCSFEYLEDELKHVYAITDVVVGRAGANSLAEIALMQKLNIMIPLKNADQQANARYFESNGAGLLMHEKDDFTDLLMNLWENWEEQNKMKKALDKIARPEAAEEIAKIILHI